MNEKRIRVALNSIAQRQVPEDVDLWPRIASRLGERRTLMQSLRARPVGLILMLLLLLSLLGGVAYAIGMSTGFIPGFGFATEDVYLLEVPVEMVHNGTSFKLENAAYDGSKLWVELSARNFSPVDEFFQAYLLTENREMILAERGGAIMPDEDSLRLTYLFSDFREVSRNVTLVLKKQDDKAIEKKFSLRPATRDSEYSGKGSNTIRKISNRRRAELSSACSSFIFLLFFYNSVALLAIRSLARAMNLLN